MSARHCTADCGPLATVHVLTVDPPEPPAVHIDRWLVDRDVNVLAAIGGSGKSTVLLATAVSCVLGRPLFGTLTVRRVGPVLLVLPEDGQAVARMILDALIEGASLSPADRSILADGLIMVPDSVTVDITAHTRRLAATARASEAILLIADPLRTLLCGKDENDNALATQVVDNLRRHLCREADATVVLSHHHDVVSGEGWVNSARSVIGLQKKGPRITAVVFKANRINLDMRHDLELVIEVDPDNAVLWRSCRLSDTPIARRDGQRRAGA